MPRLLRRGRSRRRQRHPQGRHRIVAALIVTSLGLYIVGDRLTPCTSQARESRPSWCRSRPKWQATSSRFTSATTTRCSAGSPSSTSIPCRTRSRCGAPRPAYDHRARHRRSLPRRRRGRARRARRRPRPIARWPRATPTARNGCTARTPARSRCAASRWRRPLARKRAARFAEPRPSCAVALEAAGEAGDANAQVEGARAALDKARLDLTNTHVLAPARGTVTDLQHRRRPLRASRRARDDARRRLTICGSAPT